MAAFDKGLDPGTAISDGPIFAGEIKGGGTWRPDNSDGTFGGMQPVSYGLIRSRNTMSVRVGNYAGLRKVKEVAGMAGFSTPMPERPASFLGSWEASPWEVATAYTIFPNEGARYRPYLISEIKDREGNVLYSTLPLSYQSASADSAFAVSNILKEVTSYGTAASVRTLGFNKPCGGKTGTTNDFKDAWFAGYSSALTCAVWVGFDTPKKTMHGGFGSVLSLPVWVEIMKAADGFGYKAGELHNKSGLVEVGLCRLSGKRATSGCKAADTATSELLPAESVPESNDFCPIHPARAMAVEEVDVANGDVVPLRAKVVDEAPMRAEVVEEDEAPLRALPLEEP